MPKPTKRKKPTRRAKLTQRVVDAAAPEGERYIVWDTAETGLGLLVLESGVKSFIYQYRNKHGVSRRATIKKVRTVAQARAQAIAWGDGLRSRGIDPLDVMQAAREALTVNDLLDTYLESAAFAEKSESTRGTDTGRIDNHLRPLLGKKYAADLTRESVRRAFAAITNGKTERTRKTERGLSKVRGGEGTARSAIRLLKAIINWAQDEGALPRGENPCAGVNIGSDGERDVIVDEDGYQRLFTTLDKMETERRLRSAVADGIRVVALTGARRGEIAKLQWRQVKDNRIELPPARHKSGKKTGKPRVIMLPALAQEIIKRQPAGEPDDHVFQPAGGKGVIDLSHPWERVRKEAKLPADIGLHGLRHSVGSHLAMNGAGESEIMQVLGHTQSSTVTRYIHWADKQKSILAERAAATAMAGMNAEKPKAKVRRLRK